MRDHIVPTGPFCAGFWYRCAKVVRNLTKEVPYPVLPYGTFGFLKRYSVGCLTGLEPVTSCSTDRRSAIEL